MSSSPLSPLPCLLSPLPSSPAARCPGKMWSQLCGGHAGARGLSCVGHRQARAIIQAGNWGEMWGRSKACKPPSQSLQGAPAGVGALRHVEHPKNQSKWWGRCIPLPLAGWLKIVIGKKSSWRGWEHLPYDRQQ